MTICRQLTATMILLIVLAQGLTRLHGVDQVIPGNDVACVLCLETALQKHGLTDGFLSFDPAINCLAVFLDTDPLHEGPTIHPFHSGFVLVSN